MDATTSQNGFSFWSLLPVLVAGMLALLGVFATHHFNRGRERKKHYLERLSEMADTAIAYRANMNKLYDMAINYLTTKKNGDVYKSLANIKDINEMSAKLETLVLVHLPQLRNEKDNFVRRVTQDRDLLMKMPVVGGPILSDAEWLELAEKFKAGKIALTQNCKALLDAIDAEAKSYRI